MQNDPLTHYVPRRLDDAPKFLFWDVDVAMLAFVGIFIGVYGGFVWFGVIVGIACAAGWSRLKAGKHAGMAQHVIYYFAGLPKLKALPASHVKELVG